MEPTQLGCGREFSTQGLDVVFETLKRNGVPAICQSTAPIIQKAYLEHDRLAEATRYLANALFQEYNLLFWMDMTPELKKVFCPFIAVKGTYRGLSIKSHGNHRKLVELGYMAQVYPREINLLHAGWYSWAFDRRGGKLSHQWNYRRFWPRIVAGNPTPASRAFFAQCPVAAALSRSAIAKPMLHWWRWWIGLLDAIKGYFESVSGPFPILLFRNSALLVPKKVSEKLKNGSSFGKAILEPHELALGIPKSFQK